MSRGLATMNGLPGSSRIRKKEIVAIAQIVKSEITSRFRI